MLSRLASRVSSGGILVGAVAGLALAVAVAPSSPCGGQPAVPIVPPAPAGTCTAADEAVRATAVIHFFEAEVDYATAADPAGATTQALLALPMPCVHSEHAYPALWRYFANTATFAMSLGDQVTAARLVAIGHAYNAWSPDLDLVARRLADHALAE